MPSIKLGQAENAVPIVMDGEGEAELDGSTSDGSTRDAPAGEAAEATTAPDDEASSPATIGDAQAFVHPWPVAQNSIGS